MRTPLTVGVVGADENGLAYASALASMQQASLRWLCDEQGDLSQHEALRLAGVQVTGDPAHLLADESLDAVVIGGGGRAELVRTAIAADKHVLAMAPVTHTGQDAADLGRFADARGRALVVADPLAADPAAERLKELIEAGELGEIYAVYANRQGLAPTPSGGNDGWPFGVDDLSLLLYLVEDEPIQALAHGESYIDPEVVDVAFCFLKFATGISAHLHLSWLDPVRAHRFTAIGSKRMAVLDLLAPDRKLVIHERRAPRFSGACDIVTPWIEPDDPIRVECERFVAAARSTPRAASVHRATAVVTLLETLTASLVRPVPVAGAAPRADLHVVPLRPA